jgi:hypothetical protein
VRTSLALANRRLGLRPRVARVHIYTFPLFGKGLARAESSITVNMSSLIERKIMTPAEAAETLIYECDLLFNAAEQNPASWPELLEKIRQLLGMAEQARLCSHLTIWRLRRRLAGYCERFGAGPRRRFRNG